MIRSRSSSRSKRLRFGQQGLTFQNKTSCCFSVWLFCYSDFLKHFCLFQLNEFYFSSTVFHFSSDDDLFDFLVLVSHEPLLIFCMAWSLVFISFWLNNIYLLFFPALIALMVLSTAFFFFAFMQLNAFQHQRSFATPPILSALPSCRSRCFCLQVSNCTVKNFQRVRNGLNTSDVMSQANKSLHNRGDKH